VVRTSDGWPALAYMEKIMSNTKRTESRELTDDNLAVVVGGRPDAAALAREARLCFKEGDIAGGQAALAAFYAQVGGWL
jgi:hypothetical protein